MCFTHSMLSIWSLFVNQDSVVYIIFKKKNKFNKLYTKCFAHHYRYYRLQLCSLVDVRLFLLSIQ